MQSSTSIVVGSFNNMHPFYAVAHAEPEGLNRFGRVVSGLPCPCITLRSGLWKRCHNWTGDRPARIADQVEELGIQVLCLQEVSAEHCQRQDHALCRRNASHTARDIQDALNARCEGAPWQLAVYTEFYNSKDLDYNNATRRGNAILIKSTDLELLSPEVRCYEFERKTDDKHQVRRHPWIDLRLKDSDTIVRIATGHITGYKHIPTSMRDDPERSQEIRLRTTPGDNELAGLLSRLKQEGENKPVALTIVGMDLNEDMKADQLPPSHMRRAGCGRQDGQRNTALDAHDFVSCWHQLAPEERPDTVHRSSGGCIDVLAHAGDAQIQPLAVPQEACSDHKLIAVHYTMR